VGLDTRFALICSRFCQEGILKWRPWMMVFGFGWAGQAFFLRRPTESEMLGLRVLVG